MDWKWSAVKLCFSMNAAEMWGCYSRFDWWVFWQMTDCKLMHWGNNHSVTWHKDWIITRENKSNTFGLLFWNFHVARWKFSHNWRTCNDGIGLEYILECTNNFIDSLLLGPNTGRPHSEISDYVLCTFTDLITAKKHFVGELAVWRETAGACIKDRGCAACPCVLLGFKCSSAGQGGAGRTPSIHFL